MAVEHFTYHRYEIRKVVRSVINPEITHPKTVGFRCPRCETTCVPIEHAEGVRCNECGLAMARYGNGLTCATEGERELRDGLNLGPAAPPLKMLSPLRLAP